MATDVCVVAPDLVNLYGCTVGTGSTVAPFVEIQRGAVVGRLCKIGSHSFICGESQIGDRVFIGHGVMFCNDRFPVIGGPVSLAPVVVEDDVSIGSGATLLPGVRLGRGAIVGAGAVVVRSVPPCAIVVGNPARVVRQFADLAERYRYLERQCDDLHAGA